MLKLLSAKASFSFIAGQTSISHSHLREIYVCLTQRMGEYLDAFVFDRDPLFEINDEVEIDEAYMHWRHRIVDLDWGRPEESQTGDWVVGLISRPREGIHQRLRLFCARGRKKSHLIPEIEDSIESGARVFTDALSTYKVLKDDYRLFVINKKEEGFSKIIHPYRVGEINVNVNTIEGQWRWLRSLARKRGLNNPSDVPYLCIEYMYNFYGFSWFDLLMHP